MILSRNKFEKINSIPFRNVFIIDSNWVNSKSNKNSSSKWKRLVIELFSLGLDMHVRISETSVSKYLYVSGKDKAMKIRISNHPPSVPKRFKTHSKWVDKFGNTSLIIGVNGVSANDAYYIIKETLI